MKIKFLVILCFLLLSASVKAQIKAQIQDASGGSDSTKYYVKGTLNAALAAIGAAKKTIVIYQPDTIVDNSNLTPIASAAAYSDKVYLEGSEEPQAVVLIPENVHLVAENGGSLSAKSGVKVLFQGTIDVPPLDLFFKGAGSYYFRRRFPVAPATVKTAPVRTFYPDWFQGADEQKIRAAALAAESVGGGTVELIRKFIVADWLNLNRIHAVTFLAHASKYEASEPTILFTGSLTGCYKEYGDGGEPCATRAVSLESSAGVIFKNVHVQYNNKLFTKYLVGTGHAWNHAEAANSDPNSHFLGDANGISFENCTLRGDVTIAPSNQSYNWADNAKALLSLDLAINITIERLHFLDAKVAIEGVEDKIFPAGHQYAGLHYGTWSYVVAIKHSDFNRTITDIRNPAGNWTIDNNTFEPSSYNPDIAPSDASHRVIDTPLADRPDAEFPPNGAFFTRNLSFKDNYVGDVDKQIDPFFSITKLKGGVFLANWFYGGNSTIWKFKSSDGILISGNLGNTDARMFEFVGSNSAFAVIANTVSAPRPDIGIASNSTFFSNVGRMDKFASLSAGVVDAISIQITGAGINQPVCDASKEGTHWYLKGGFNVASREQICMKRSNNIYEWRDATVAP